MAESWAGDPPPGRFFRGPREALGFTLCGGAVLQTLTEEVIQSSEMEGKILGQAQVRSSIARRLGMGAMSPPARHVEGVVELMLVRHNNIMSCLRPSGCFTGMLRSFRQDAAA